MKNIQISIIVAAAVGGLIGNTATNSIPWYLPKDLRHFKQVTTGHLLISGRKTYESFGKPLPSREHIIVSRDPEYVPTNGNEFTHVRSSFEEALQYANEIAGERTIFIVGGGQLYAEALSNPAIKELIKEIIVSHVEGEFEGDVYFPYLSPLEWREISSETFEPDEKNAYRFTVKTYVRFDTHI